jgi:hypothetical protein
MKLNFDDRWVIHFQKNGYPQATGIATGMEGAVYSLSPGELVAKVWSRRSESDLRRLQTFYGRLASFHADIRTPEILDVDMVDGTLISKERFLPGKPLERYLQLDARHADRSGVDATIGVLEFLKSIPNLTELDGLAVLDETDSFWSGASTWSEAIGGLISRRVARFGSQLRSEIPDLKDVVAAIGMFLDTRDTVPMGIIHGDLCGVNIMVDTDRCPLSVFDFGFLSSVGDPAFDASVASAIFNMYGPHARDIDDEVTDAFVLSLGFERRVMLAYRAAYALITSNAYAPDGSDGHYRWCVTMLRREDVRSSLGL